jgi:hypothetical protein
MNGIFNTVNITNLTHTDYPNEVTDYEQHQLVHQNTYGFSHIEQIQLTNFDSGSEPKTKVSKLNSKKQSQEPISNPDHEANKSIKHYDGAIVSQQFIDYFYTSWCTNIDLLLTEEIIKPYSKLKYNSITYEGAQFIEILKMFTASGLGLAFSDCRCEILDSGSRQIYMLVTGIIVIEQVPKTFSQTFMIAYTGENIKKGPRKWTLMNSLLIVN